MKKVILLIFIFLCFEISAGIFDLSRNTEKDFETYYLECEGTKSSLSSKGTGVLTAAKMRIMMRDSWKAGYITSIALTANSRVYLKKIRIFDDFIQFKTKRFQGHRKTIGAIDRETGEINWIADRRFEFNGVCEIVEPWSPDDSLDKEFRLPKEKKKF
jgi:hypothetical protein